MDGQVAFSQLTVPNNRIRRPQSVCERRSTDTTKKRDPCERAMVVTSGGRGTVGVCIYRLGDCRSVDGGSTRDSRYSRDQVGSLSVDTIFGSPEVESDY